ncbi:hypothetical protein SeLEV6574_g02849 [Synchytrium endobioticum]|nr:hypothetical protein SeLEV6574_g02849 [Synchytrium endobioticum]
MEMDGPDQCPEDRNPAKLYIGVFILLGLVVSYAPQLFKIYRIKSSEGLSSYFLGLGMIGTISTWLNTFMLQFAAMKCCQTHWSADVCFQNTLGFTQMTVQATCFTALFTLYYSFYPTILKYRTSPASSIRVPPTRAKTQYSAAYRSALYVVMICIFFLAIAVITSISTLIVGAHDPNRTAIEGIAGVWGGIATLTGITQFLPQIWHTFSLRRPGALSIETLLMQCPGSFLFAYSLAIQPRTNWSSWLPFFAAGTLQFILLALCTYFLCINPGVIIGNPEDRERLLGPSDEEVPIPTDESNRTAGDRMVDVTLEQEHVEGDDIMDGGTRGIVGTRQGSPDANRPRLDSDRPKTYHTLSRARGNSGIESE